MTSEGTWQQVLAGEARFAVVHGDCLDVLRAMQPMSIDHVITDPPYSEQVHKSVRSSGRNAHPDVAEFSCRSRRVVDLGFAHLDPTVRAGIAVHASRLVKRWTLVFSDVEGCHLWRTDLEYAGLNYRRTGAWRRIGGAPQFTGDRPASGFEAITMAHRKGRSRWNGGGCAAVYEHAIVANRLGERGSRVHPTQKPESLMVELVELFTDPDEIVLDPFCGSGTTGLACLRLGRRFIGIEMNAEWAEVARERLRAEADSSTLQARRAGQGALFGGTP